MEHLWRSRAWLAAAAKHLARGARLDDVPHARPFAPEGAQDDPQVVAFLLLQRADELHQFLDLIASQLAFVGRHLALALRNNAGQVGVRLLLHIG